MSEWMMERLRKSNETLAAEVARMKKLHAPPADLPWPSREEAKP